MDQLKFYVNPEIFKAEKGIGDEYVHVNSAFEMQSRTGRATGKPESPKIVTDSLARAQELLKSDDNKIFINGYDGLERLAEDLKDEEEDTLG